MELLRLKEAVSNAPHSQQLASQFDADAVEIGVLLQKFHTACCRVYAAQESLAQAYLQLSDISRVVGAKALTVQPKNVDFENTSLQFSSLLEELSGLHRAHAEDIRTSLFMPAHKLPSQPGLQLMDKYTGNVVVFADLPETRKNREASETEVTTSLTRYMRLGRRCAPREHDDGVMELCQLRRVFQKAAVIYHARLNASHFERELIPLNAYCGFLNAVKKHTKRISEMTELPSLAEFAEVIKGQLDCRQVESVQANEDFLNSLTDLESKPLAVFAPEPLFAKSDKSYLRSPDNKLLSKAGFLFMRVKKTFGFDWTQVFCYTQGGNLFCQAKGDLGASVLVNLNGKGVFPEPVDIDERRNTFQVVCAAEKSDENQLQTMVLDMFVAKRSPNVILQAENSTDRDEWIATICNVIAKTNSWAGKGEASPDPQPKEQLPFVLAPKMQFGCPDISPTHVMTQENDDLQQALRASLSSSEWISQDPPLHLELIAIGDPAESSTVTSADADNGFEALVHFIGCMPIPEFMTFAVQS